MRIRDVLITVDTNIRYTQNPSPPEVMGFKFWRKPNKTSYLRVASLTNSGTETIQQRGTSGPAAKRSTYPITNVSVMY